MSPERSVYVMERSAAAPLARAVAWLWRLGEPLDRPLRGAVGFGTTSEAAELSARVHEGLLAGAVILAGPAGDAAAPVPGRRSVGGTARFGATRVRAELGAFESGTAAVRSSLGIHAIRDGRVLMLAVGSRSWGHLDSFWVLPAIAELLVEVLDRPLVTLPPIGCLRLDDAPGTIELQLLERAKPDREELGRIRTMLRALERTRSRLVVATPARALAGEDFVPLDHVWPECVAALRGGDQAAVLEAACHGLYHLDLDAHAAGRVEPREFLSLDEAEAGRRLDAAIAWLREHLGEPRSFIAPAWGYSPGAIAAARARSLPVWTPPEPGPLLQHGLLYETLHDGLPGLHALNYAPLARLAAVGLPPTVVFHGRLLDDRLPRLGAARDVMSLARLARRRDLERIAALGGVRWVGAADLVATLAAHDRIEVRGAEPDVPFGERAMLIDDAGVRPA
jgi:hypothetical protein